MEGRADANERPLHEDPKVQSPDAASTRSARALKITKEASSLANSLLLEEREQSAHSQRAKLKTRQGMDAVRLKVNLDKVDESTSNNFGTFRQPNPI